MKTIKKIQVKGKSAQKLRKIAASKSATLKAMKQKPVMDISKIPVVG